jgi:hypothetical protein
MIQYTLIPGTPPTIELKGNIICDGTFGIEASINGGPPITVIFSNYQIVGSYWKATINDNFSCGSSIKIYVTCLTNNITSSIDSVIFNTPPCADCPSALINVTNIGDCDATGKRPVTFEAVITPGSMPAVGQWRFYTYPNSPTNNPASYTPGQNSIYVPQSGTPQPAAETISFPPTMPGHLHTACIHWNNPPHANCPDVLFQFSVPECLPPCCPQDDLNIIINNIRTCISQNPEFAFTVRSKNCPLPSIDNYIWTIDAPNGDSFQLVRGLSVNTNNPDWEKTNVSPRTLGAVDLSTVGQYLISVSLLNGNRQGCIPVKNVSFIVTTCCPDKYYWDTQQKTCIGCPAITTPQVIVTGTSPGGTPATAFSTSISPAIVASYNWEVVIPGGTIFIKTSMAPNTTNDIADGVWTNRSTGATGALDISVPGSYQVYVTAIGSGISQACSVSGTTQFSIPSPPAPCPMVTTPMATVTSTAGTTTVTFSSTVTPAVASSFDWEVTTPGGATFTKSTLAPSTTDGITDGMWTNKSTGATGALDISAPGSYGVSVNAVGAAISPTCKPSSPGSFIIPMTSVPPPSTPNWGCISLRWIAVILLILSGLLFIIYFCAAPILTPQVANVILGIAIGLAVIGIILLLLWLALPGCSAKPCGWGLLIAWQVLIGIGIFALYFSKCCPWTLILGLIAILAGIVILIIWVVRCRITLCTVIIELFPVFTTVIAVVGYFALVPFIASGCINTIVGAVVGTLSAILAFWALGCATTGGRPAGN